MPISMLRNSLSILEIWVISIGSLLLLFGLLTNTHDAAVGLLLICSGLTIILARLKSPARVIIANISLFAIVISAIIGVADLLLKFFRP